MKSILSQTLIALFCLSLVSCASVNTKEDYMKDFSAFSKKVEKQKDKKSAEEWKSFDEEFKKLNEELYNEFEGELSLSDQIKINSYRLRYAIKRGKSEIIKELKGNEDLKELRVEIQKYIEEDMDQDVETLIEEAEKVSKEFGAAVKEIADELKKEVE